MTSLSANWIFVTADSFAGSLQSPAQTPLVRGWVGCAERAQAKAAGSIAATSSTLFFGSSKRLPLVLSGSFQMSQARMRSSLAKRETTPVTYAFSLGSYEGSVSSTAPGLWTQPELWTPG